MTRERQARLLIAKGYSCEQAIFGAFADLLGCSTVGAALMAPQRKDRGRTCGAYTAGVMLIRRVYGQPERQPIKKRDEQRQEQRRKKAVEIEEEFRKLFLANFGTLDCAEIKRAVKKAGLEWMMWWAQQRGCWRECSVDELKRLIAEIIIILKGGIAKD